MITLDKTTVSEFDIVIGLDASGSMGSPSKRFPGKTRWQEAQETIYGIACEVSKYDSDGLDIVIFGGNVEVHPSVQADKVASVFMNRDPRGGTPLHGALKKIVDKQTQTGKNTVAIIFTDGVPDDRVEAAKTIVNATKNLQKDEALTFLFVQIGDDPEAAKYLKVLDDDLTGAKFDIVDTISAAEADTMSALDLINKALND